MIPFTSTHLAGAIAADAHYLQAEMSKPTTESASMSAYDFPPSPPREEPASPRACVPDMDLGASDTQSAQFDGARISISDCAIAPASPVPSLAPTFFGSSSRRKSEPRRSISATGTSQPGVLFRFPSLTSSDEAEAGHFLVVLSKEYASSRRSARRRRLQQLRRRAIEEERAAKDAREGKSAHAPDCAVPASPPPSDDAPEADDDDEFAAYIARTQPVHVPSAGNHRHQRTRTASESSSALASSEGSTSPYPQHMHTPQHGGRGPKECASCGTRKTPMWRDDPEGTPLCNACGIRYKKYRVRCPGCRYIPRKDENPLGKCSKCKCRLVRDPRAR
eukprot:Opistho-2@59477